MTSEQPMSALCPMCGKQFADAVYCPSDGVRLVPTHDSAGRIGTTIGDRYRIVRKIGQGGSGEVFEAEHVYIHKRVALKLLRSQVPSRAEAIQRLHREARATSAIGHPHIVEIEDFGTTEDGAVFMAMEWLEGEPLDVAIARGAMPVERALAIARQVCEGLAAAHEAGVIHRDLKPENIFLARTPEGERAKILDFGVAKLTTADARLTATGMVVGTPYYMAPEQAAGRDVDARSDIYALGVILYEMVTGTLPFTGSTALAVIHAHLDQAPEPPRRRAPALGIPAQVEALILRCMAKKPGGRPASARALADDLRALPDAREGHAGPAVAPAEANASADASRARDGDAARTALVGERASQRRGRLTLVLAGVALGLACGAATFALVRNARESGAPVVARDGGSAPAGIVGQSGEVGDAGAGAGAAPVDAARRPPIDAAARVAEVIVDAAPRATAGGTPDASPRAPRAPQPRGAVDASVGRAPAASAWRFTAKTDDFDYEVVVTPAVVTAGAPFTLEIGLVQAIDDILIPLRAGRLQANVSFLHFQNHQRTGGGSAPVSTEGVLRKRVTLPRNGKYHVALTLVGRGKRRFQTQFDICVGADPRSKAAARVCPRMNRR